MRRTNDLAASAAATPIVRGAPEVLDAPVAGELLPGPETLLAAALGVAASQAAVRTRQTYADTYRKFTRFLRFRCGCEPRVEDFTREALQDYRYELERAERAPATIAKDLSALRRLAAELELDARILRVKAGASRPKEPRPLTREQLEVLLRAPDARTRMGKRDRAMLYLMASPVCGAARSST